MYPSYHTHPDLARIHQAEIRAQRDALRQAKLAAEGDSGTGVEPSLWGRFSGYCARLPQLILHPRTARTRPVLKNAPAPRG